MFNGFTLTEDEYLRVESLYVEAAVRFAVCERVERFRIAYVGHQNSATTLSLGQLVARSDIAPVVRGNLRGDLDCVLEADDGRLQLAFGYDLYMYVASRTDCARAVAWTEESGLYVERGVSPAYWDDGRG